MFFFKFLFAYLLMFVVLAKREILEKRLGWAVRKLRLINSITLSSDLGRVPPSREAPVYTSRIELLVRG